jgi:uncharacterized repeat protein (TIGR04076 family)
MIMTQVKITVLQIQDPKELWGDKPPVSVSDSFGSCERHYEGQEFIVEEDFMMPEGFCHWSWNGIQNAVRMLLFGGDYPWSIDKGSAVVCCNDGLRPVIYKLERITN